MKNLAAHQIIFFATAALLLVSTLPLHYDFYLPMRTLVAVSSGYLVYTAYTMQKYSWIALGASAFVIFAPVFGFSFEKPVWIVFDLIFAFGFVMAALSMRVEAGNEG